MYVLMASAFRSAASSFMNNTSSGRSSNFMVGSFFFRRLGFGLSKALAYSSTAIRSLPFMVLSIWPGKPGLLIKEDVPPCLTSAPCARFLKLSSLSPLLTLTLIWRLLGPHHRCSTNLRTVPAMYLTSHQYDLRSATQLTRSPLGCVS